MTHNDSRYRQVSRRAVLRSTLGAGAAAVIASCGTGDSEVFSGAIAEPVDTTTTSTSTSTTDAPEGETTSTTTTDAPEGETTTTTDAPEGETTTTTTSGSLSAAVAGTMAITFTYTRAAGGKLESPYVAVWIEDVSGQLLETVALFYEQSRRGARWLDHLDRWWAVDSSRIAAGGVDDAATISSATRPPGAYAVAWDGAADGQSLPAGDYFVCIESAREDGPYSLIRQPLTLNGTLAEMPLPDEGELSAASVRIDV